MMPEKKTKLLLVDDEESIVSMLKTFLELSGFEVVAARNGIEALAYTEEHRPDLIVLDVLMPHLDGRETLRQLRSRGDWTPVILLTQVTGTAQRIMAIEEGADDYLNKPFDPQELVVRIRAVLRRTKAGQQPLQIPDQKIDVQRPLMGLVDDDRVIGPQVAIGLGFGQQDAVGHQFDERLGRGLVTEADFIRHPAVAAGPEFFGQPRRNTPGRQAPRLCVADHAAEAQAGFEAQLGQLRALAAAGLAANDHDLMLLNQPQNRVAMRRNRQIGGVLDRRNRAAAQGRTVH